MEFEGKVAAITGGGTGIGAAVARALHERGARIVLNGRREDVLAQLATSLDSSGRTVAIVAGDVARPDTAQRLVSVAVERFGGLDILVNAAGIFRPTPFLEHKPSDVDGYLDTILKGTFYSSQAAVPALKARGGGAIVNVGSMWAEQAIGATPSSAYSAAKAGVHALTRNLAIELAKDNIRVNTVAPAVVDTPVYESFVPKDQIRAVLASFDAFHPLGRIGQPGDLAEAVLFLASKRASWISGTILPVDGGVLAGRA